MRLATGLLVLVIACRSETPAPAPARVAAVPAPVSTDAGVTDPLSEKLRHCPLTVQGAAVELHDVDGGVEFLVRVPAEQRAELTKRARHLEAFTRNKGKNTGVTHGGGQGGGWMRDCPVVTKDTLVEATETPEGARIRVALSESGDVEALRAETRRRLAALRARQTEQ